MSERTFTPFSALELLSPARDFEVGRAAIDCGADAVYIGGPGFGARSAATNSLQDIGRLADYAHRFHARVYLTLNTILFEDELEKAVKTAWGAYEAGIDALIVQDMGLLVCDLPPVELHASTQCDIRTPEKAAFLDAAGFSQIVLARELTLEEIARCRAAMPRARIEFFVHGALCVSYSGQCYLSCARFDRSANRGACAQPCRLPYSAYDINGQCVAKGKHLLSLKDNDQSANLEALVQAGVSSFKIEGRLKDADYVKNITAYYRQKLDQLLEEKAWPASSLGKTVFTFSPDPRKTFHRDATDYFVRGRQASIATLDTPKSTGEPLGKVVHVNRSAQRSTSCIEVQSSATIANGDGLIYHDADGVLHGLAVNRAEQTAPRRWRIYPAEGLDRHKGLIPGAELNRNKDRLFTQTVLGNCSERRISVHYTLSVCRDEIKLTASSAPFSAVCSQCFAAEPAKNPEKALETIRGNLAKTGDTVFRMEGMSLETPTLGTNAAPFIPASILNELRRRALEGLEKAIADGFSRRPPLPARPAEYPERTLDWRANVANSKARAFYQEHGVAAIADAFELTGPAQDSAAELMRCRHCIRHTIGLCPKTVKGDPAKKALFMQRNGGHLKPEPLTLIDERGRKLVAQFDCRRCEMTIGVQ